MLCKEHGIFPFTGLKFDESILPDTKYHGYTHHNDSDFEKRDEDMKKFACELKERSLDPRNYFRDLK